MHIQMHEHTCTHTRLHMHTHHDNGVTMAMDKVPRTTFEAPTDTEVCER